MFSTMVSEPRISSTLSALLDWAVEEEGAKYASERSRLRNKVFITNCEYNWNKGRNIREVSALT